VKNENYSVSSKPGQIEDFHNSQGHFLLVNLPMNEEGTLNSHMCLKSLHLYIEQLEQDIYEGITSKNKDHGMDNMTADASNQLEDPPVQEEL
jgi:hypothetical protein